MKLSKKEKEVLIEILNEHIKHCKNWNDLDDSINRFIRINKDGSYHKSDAELAHSLERQHKRCVYRLEVCEPLLEKLI